MKKVKSLLVVLVCLAVPSIGMGQDISTAITEQTIKIAPNAYSGSSVNVVSGGRQNIFTHSTYQYTGFYDAQSRLVLAKRRLGEKHWQKQVTEFKGNTADAHNSISLIVDGSGILHVSWNHHNSPLNYAKGEKAGSLQIKKAPMLGAGESSLTYPHFYRLSNGDLIFQYRDGGSGRGVMKMNYYSVSEQKWRSLNDNVLDGEGIRSAYWSMDIDKNDVMHLAWVWRETPDVATNHDLFYVQSKDQGQSWQTIDGEKVYLPITADNVEYVTRIPQNHKLMNPPMVAADRLSNPFIANYWADSPDQKPRFRVVHYTKETWETVSAPPPKENFDLKGMGTKRPPYSRPLLLVESDWHNSWFHLIYRDDFEDAVIAATVKDLNQPKWELRRLVDGNLGAWEPSFDPEQWRRMGQAQMLIQDVTQIDGNDHSAADTPPSELDLLIWSPNWERHQNLTPTPSGELSINKNSPLEKAKIAKIAEKAALWQWQNVPAGWDYDPTSWTMAPFYIGNIMVANIVPEADLIQKVIQQSDAIEWKHGARLGFFDADDYAVSQAYLRLYLQYEQEKMLLPSKHRLDEIIQNRPTASLDWGTPGGRERWGWSDALFMGPMSFLLMYQATEDEKYLNFMNEEWWATAERLYSPEIGLYFRDESYLDLRERNGQTIHWARGTGWSIAGLAQVIEYFPKDHPDYANYVKQFKEMANAFRKAQQDNGLWRPGLLDPDTHTAKETSGSSFAVYSLAWGINNGLLDDSYKQAVMTGWNALTDSVTEQGKLENVQPIGAAPYGFAPKNSEPFATGAFLMAASEVYKLAK
ncbi:BNR-4 repeat-containing protein [Glaciecola sp. 1036]|uniref:BNR-4 repeat-containing protein n=1 Tax=Alteromonadaceae TaxID=72275 RepID=UPI003CFF8C0E